MKLKTNKTKKQKEKYKFVICIYQDLYCSLNIMEDNLNLLDKRKQCKYEYEECDNLKKEIMQCNILEL